MLPPRLPDAGAARPDDVRSLQSGIVQPLSPPPTVSRPARNRRDELAVAASRGCCSGRGRRAVLAVAVHVVGNLIVGGDVIDLRDSETAHDATCVPRFTVMPTPPSLTRRSDAIASWIQMSCKSPSGGAPSAWPPASPDSRDRPQRCAAVERLAERRREEIRFVFVVRLHRHAEVVMRTAARLVTRGHHLPVLAAIVDSPELAGRRRLSFPGLARAGFDHGVDALGIALGDREPILPTPARAARVPPAASRSRRRRAT